MTASAGTLIGIDPSSKHCGVAIYKNGRYVDSFVKDFKGNFDLIKFKDIVNYFNDLFARYSPDNVVIEQPLFHNSGLTTRVLNMIGGSIFAAACLSGAEVTFLYPATVKKIMGIPQHGKETKQESIREALELTGKLVTDDESDAILVSESFIRQEAGK